MAYRPTPAQGSGLVGAAIVGVSILAGSFMLNETLEDTSEQLQAIQTSLTETRAELKTIASQRPSGSTPRRAGGLDPDEVYAINTKGSPAKGSARAKVELVEFSDFQ
jgi:hypothetical protein